MKKFAAALFAATFFLITGFGGCAALVPQTPQQAVYEAKTAYAAALSVAVAYKRLPACTPDNGPPCSDKAVVAQLQKADTVASTALDAAESVVRTPGFGKDVIESSLAAAKAALAAFTSITQTFKKG